MSKFTLLCFQPGIECSSAYCNHGNHHRLTTLARLAFNLVEFCETAHLGIGFCFIGNTPALLSNAVLVVDFGQLAPNPYAAIKTAVQPAPVFRCPLFAGLRSLQTGIFQSYSVTESADPRCCSLSAAYIFSTASPAGRGVHAHHS